MSHTATPAQRRTRTVHVVGFVTANGVGGFEWRDTEQQAQAALAELDLAPNGDTAVRAIDVPASLRGGHLTRWLDRRPDLWEPDEGDGSPRTCATSKEA